MNNEIMRFFLLRKINGNMNQIMIKYDNRLLKNAFWVKIYDN